MNSGMSGRSGQRKRHFVKRDAVPIEEVEEDEAVMQQSSSSDVDEDLF